MQIIEHAPTPSAPAPEPPRWVRGRRRVESSLQRPGTARVILFGSLLATALAWWAARLVAQDDAQQRFERRADEIQHRIERRMGEVEALLRAGVALLSSRPDTDRAGWKHFVDTLDLASHYPGIQGFGVSRLLSPGELAAHVQSVRAEGYPEFEVHPAGRRAEYSSIVYLEPMDRRNRRAFGFDMLSEPTRREAMLLARDSAQAALSGIVTLVQEDGHDVQPGFLMYLPVLHTDPGAAGTTTLWGWVYAPFRAQDLMHGIFGDDESRGIALRIHDGPPGPPAHAFFARTGGAAAPADDAETLTRELTVAQRRWSVVFQRTDEAIDAWPAHLVAIVGVAFDLLLYWSITSLSRRKSQVEREVSRSTAVVADRTQWLTAVTGLSPDGILVFQRDAQGALRLVFTNPAFSQWFGLMPSEMLGLTEGAVDEWLLGLCGKGESMAPLAQGETTLMLAGPPRRVLRRGMRETETERVYYFRDVTHETEVDTLKNEFLSTAAHELRTPLASVYGFSELMLDSKIDNAKRSRAARIVYRQASVLKHLVDELLDLARIDSRGGRDFRFARHDLRRIADLAAESMLKPDEMPRIDRALGTVPAWCDIDPAKMQQAIVNVLGNALKYSQPPAGVGLSLQLLPRLGQTQIALRVVDSGIGMTPEQCGRAFERFYRADPSGHILGAGLGLSIVKEIVDLHHGAVELHSTPGAGTQFTIWLPLKTAPVESVGRDTAPRPAEAEPQAAALGT